MSYYPCNNGAYFSFHIFTAFFSFPSCLTWSDPVPTTTCRKENSNSGYVNASSAFSCMYTHACAFAQAHTHSHTKTWYFPALLQSSWDEASWGKTERTLFVSKSLYRPAVSAPIPLSRPSGSYAHNEFTTSCMLTPCSRFQTSKWHIISESVWLSAFLGKQDPHRECKGVVMNFGLWNIRALSPAPSLCKSFMFHVTAHPWHEQRESKRKHDPDDVPVAQRKTKIHLQKGCHFKSVLLLPEFRDSRFIYSHMTGSVFTNCLKRVKFATVVKR